MKTFKFETRISEDGSLKVPVDLGLNDTLVDVIVVRKEKKKSHKDLTEGFIDKWAGFLEATSIDSSKFDYLSDKYS
ncbi:MAG: hypothetical protein JXQ96_06490 [Cyclobacteriaceae bacterium]